MDHGFTYVSDHARYSYQSTFHDNRSWQACGAAVALYMVQDGEWVEESLMGQDEYLNHVKSGTVFNIYSGFRVWADKDQSETIAAADADMVPMRITDWSAPKR